MHYWLLATDRVLDLGEPIEASSRSEAMAVAVDIIHAKFRPRDSTYWVEARLFDDRRRDFVMSWNERIDPVPGPGARATGASPERRQQWPSPSPQHPVDGIHPGHRPSGEKEVRHGY